MIFFNPKVIIDLVKEWRKLKTDHLLYGTWAIVLTVTNAAVWIGIPSFVAFKFLGSEPHVAYSNGNMKAKSAKMSNKGIIFNTNEGYILTGSVSEGVAEKWYYSTTNKEVVDCVNNNEVVNLKYTQYVFVPYSVGDSHHIVTECTAVK